MLLSCQGLKEIPMKKKLLVLLIAVIPTLMPNLASAVAIDVGDVVHCLHIDADCVIAVIPTLMPHLQGA